MTWLTAAPAIPRLVLETRVVGLPVDSFTGRPPAGTMTYELLVVQMVGGQPVREPTRFNPFVTGRGVVTFPALEESPAATGQPFVLLVDPGEVRARYPTPGTPGFDFAFPGPGGLRRVSIDLRPGPAYPYPRHVPVVRGLVRLAGEPVPDVVVSAGNDTALSDASGRFSLGVRVFTDGQPLTVQADDGLGHTGVATEVVPDIFQQSVPIDIA
jgi:hypothetical protein